MPTCIIQRAVFECRVLYPTLRYNHFLVDFHGANNRREVFSMYEDKTLVCKDCGKEFVFTAGEQEFYAERGFQNEPQRCKACRDARKNNARGPREFFTATCARCGGEAKVPFQPKSDRPVFCSECFAQMRANG